MGDDEPRLYRVTLTLCNLCAAGVGGECHTAGCALWMSQAPTVPVVLERARLLPRQIDAVEHPGF